MRCLVHVAGEQGVQDVESRFVRCVSVLSSPREAIINRFAVILNVPLGLILVGQTALKLIEELSLEPIISALGRNMAMPLTESGERQYLNATIILADNAGNTGEGYRRIISSLSRDTLNFGMTCQMG